MLLDEAREIVERGPMPLVLADIHLRHARLFESQRSENTFDSGVPPLNIRSPGQNLVQGGQFFVDSRFRCVPERVRDQGPEDLSEAVSNAVDGLACRRPAESCGGA